MSVKKIKEIDSFPAFTDTGTEYRIFQYQEYIDASTAQKPNATIPGLKFMETSDGFHVNYLDDNTYQIVETGEIVRRG